MRSLCEAYLEINFLNWRIVVPIVRLANFKCVYLTSLSLTKGLKVLEAGPVKIILVWFLLSFLRIREQVTCKLCQ